MPGVFVGTIELTDVGDIKINGTDVQEVYVGSVKVFPSGSPPTPTPDILWDLVNEVLPGTSTFTRNDDRWYRNDSGVWVNAGVNVPRYHNLTPGGGEKGLLFEPPTTKLAIQRRDLTDAAWVKTNVTPAKDATGIDGVASSCSTLTATANNGTALQTVTSSGSNSAQFFVARKTGTGTVEITIDNGVTWIDITSSLTSSIDNEFNITQSITDPTIGFRLGTSGDEIEVDCCDVETGLRPTTPFVQDNTGSESRDNDDLIDSTTLAAEHSFACDATVDALIAAGNEQATLLHYPPSGSSSFFVEDMDTFRLNVFSGLVVQVTAATSYENERHGFAYSAKLDEGIAVDDEDNDNQSLSGAQPTGTIRIGSRAGTSRWWHSVIHTIRYYEQTFTAQELKDILAGTIIAVVSLGYAADLVGYGADTLGYVV